MIVYRLPMPRTWIDKLKKYWNLSNKPFGTHFFWQFWIVTYVTMKKRGYLLYQLSKVVWSLNNTNFTLINNLSGIVCKSEHSTKTITALLCLCGVKFTLAHALLVPREGSCQSDITKSETCQQKLSPSAAKMLQLNLYYKKSWATTVCDKSRWRRWFWAKGQVAYLHVKVFNHTAKQLRPC